MKFRLRKEHDHSLWQPISSLPLTSYIRPPISDLFLNKVRKALLHLPKIPDAEPEEECGDRHADAEALGIERGVAAEDAPAEAINDADHGIEGIEQAPFLWDDTAGEADRRNVKAELHDERDDITEIPVFHIERGDPEARPEGGDQATFEFLSKRPRPKVQETVIGPFAQLSGEL